MRLPLLILHISGGVLGMLSGALAMIYRKGSRGHRLSGNVFVVSMLTMAVAASILAYKKHQTGNFYGGMLTFYLVATAWATARRSDNSRQTGVLDWIAFLFATTIGSVGLIQGLQEAMGTRVPEAGGQVFMSIFMSSVILLAGLGDLRMLVRGISGTARLSRHLWRMCFGWFIATGSFFLGQQQVFPASWRGSPAFLVPALLPLALLIFWMVRVRVGKRYKDRVAGRGGVEAYSVRV